MKAWPYPRIVAHRGGGSLAPENTLAAIDVGASHGHTMIDKINIKIIIKIIIAAQSS